jgi:hypothetical protein
MSTELPHVLRAVLGSPNLNDPKRSLLQTSPMRATSTRRDERRAFPMSTGEGRSPGWGQGLVLVQKSKQTELNDVSTLPQSNTNRRFQLTREGSGEVTYNGERNIPRDTVSITSHCALQASPLRTSASQAMGGGSQLCVLCAMRGICLRVYARSLPVIQADV